MVTNNESSPNEYRHALSMEGRTVVVVGAGQGMGHEAARAVRSVGAHVVCIDRDAQLAENVASELDGLALSVDVTDRVAVSKAFEEIYERSGALHAVIDVVGAAAWHSVLDDADDLLEQQFALNYRQALHVLQAAAPLMKDPTGGAFAFVTSASGIRGAQQHSAYGAAKAALTSLVRSSAVELASDGIRVNAVAPGVIMTPRTQEGLFNDREFVDSQAASVPLGRFGKPHEIAAMLAFLVSEASAYITGQNIVVDGGVDAKFPHLIKEQK